VLNKFISTISTSGSPINKLVIHLSFDINDFTDLEVSLSALINSARLDEYQQVKPSIDCLLELCKGNSEGDETRLAMSIDAIIP
jgi:hypothetical protein